MAANDIGTATAGDVVVVIASVHNIVARASDDAGEAGKHMIVLAGRSGGGVAAHIQADADRVVGIGEGRSFEHVGARAALHLRP